MSASSRVLALALVLAQGAVLPSCATLASPRPADPSGGLTEPGEAQTERDEALAEAPQGSTPPSEDVVLGPARPGAPRIESANAIPDERTWQALAARPVSSTVAHTEVVKFLLDRFDGRRIWFVDTERWDIHFDFASERLGVPSGYQSHDDFNRREYRSSGRRFELGSLVHYVDSDQWTLEMIAGDTLDAASVARLFHDLQRQVFFGDRLRYRPMSPAHEAMLQTMREPLPVATASEVFAGVVYQPLTTGTAYGTLRIVRGALDPASVRPDEILVLEHLPDEIPVVSGVISSELEAPLGHIAILCATRGTPNMGLRDAVTRGDVTALDGHLVRLVVSGQDYTLVPATRAEAEASWASRRPAAVLTPPIDASDSRIRQVCDVRMDDVRRVGAKAAQLGEVCGAGARVRTPGGFTVPFHFYLQHLEQVAPATSPAITMASELQGLLRDAPTLDGPTLDARLRTLREHILAAPVDAALLTTMRERMNQVGRGRRFIVRSSTNAEDLPGFTGAGLYRSIVVSADASDAELADAMRGVWASVWLLGAFEERAWYRVDQSRVAMALLVQPFVDGASANGVAITANPYYEGRPGFLINAQALGGSVTGAAGDEVPEQHLVYMYAGVEPELLSASSRSPSTRLLDERRLIELSATLHLLHCHFRALWQRQGRRVDGRDALDIEFLVAGADRHIVILQARPYRVHYEPGAEQATIDLCDGASAIAE